MRLCALHVTLYLRLVTVNELDVARRQSAALFNNEKLVEIVLAVEKAAGVTHAQELSRATSISHSLVRAVLIKLVGAGALIALPKSGGARSTQYYQPIDGELWSALVALAKVIANRPDSDASAQPLSGVATDLTH